MKTYHRTLLLILLSVFSSVAFGQNKDDAKALVKAGVVLNDEGKYDDALAKYSEAIKADPTYVTAYYETGYTYFSSNRGKEGIPFLEKVLKLDPNSAGAYDMLGSIYDDDKQYDKALDYYKKGLAVNPGYQRLYFNLAIFYLNQKKYVEAESNAVQAIKLEPKHASSQRAYAVATFNEGKRGISLLAWSSFLLLEPQTKRSLEAYRYIHNIINYGITKKDDKNVNISLSIGDMDAGNIALPIAILSATTDKKNLTRTDSLKLQLKSIYQVGGTFDASKKDEFYKHYYADYFSKLAETDNMEAFARLVSLATYQEENVQWFKDNSPKLSALDAWVTATKREF